MQISADSRSTSLLVASKEHLYLCIDSNPSSFRLDSPPDARKVYVCPACYVLRSAVGYTVVVPHSDGDSLNVRSIVLTLSPTLDFVSFHATQFLLFGLTSAGNVYSLDLFDTSKSVDISLPAKCSQLSTTDTSIGFVLKNGDSYLLDLTSKTATPQRLPLSNVKKLFLGESYSLFLTHDRKSLLLDMNNFDSLQTLDLQIQHAAFHDDLLLCSTTSTLYVLAPGTSLDPLFSHSMKAISSISASSLGFFVTCADTIYRVYTGEDSWFGLAFTLTEKELHESPVLTPSERSVSVPFKEYVLGDSATKDSTPKRIASQIDSDETIRTTYLNRFISFGDNSFVVISSNTFRHVDPERPFTITVPFEDVKQLFVSSGLPIVQTLSDTYHVFVPLNDDCSKYHFPRIKELDGCSIKTCTMLPTESFVYALSNNGSLYKVYLERIMSSSQSDDESDDESPKFVSKVPDIENIRQISVSKNTIACVTFDGNLIFLEEGAVFKLESLSNVKQVALAEYHGLIVLNDGTLLGWANDSDCGFLPESVDKVALESPIKIDLPPMDFVAVTQDFSMCLTFDQKVYIFGKNANFKAGIEADDDHVFVPTLLPFSKVKHVDCSKKLAFIFIDDVILNCGGHYSRPTNPEFTEFLTVDEGFFPKLNQIIKTDMYSSSNLVEDHLENVTEESHSTELPSTPKPIAGQIDSDETIRTTYLNRFISFGDNSFVVISSNTFRHVDPERPFTITVPFEDVKQLFVSSGLPIVQTLSDTYHVFVPLNDDCSKYHFPRIKELDGCSIKTCTMLPTESFVYALSNNGSLYKVYLERIMSSSRSDDESDDESPKFVSKVPDIENIRQISVSKHTIACVTFDGSLIFLEEDNVFKLESLSNVKQVALAEYHGLIVLNDGTLFGWADDSDCGFLPESVDKVALESPIKIDLPPMDFVAVTQDFSMCLTLDQKVYIFGKNANFKAGIEADDDHVFAPTLLPFSKVKHVDCSKKLAFIFIDDVILNCGGHYSRPTNPEFTEFLTQ
ncbi:hypothetical protein GEMRC1_004238 [Eukaryota sp. GEM-RC1]